MSQAPAPAGAGAPCGARDITFLNNCWDYREDTSEIRLGKALRDGHQEKIFLMTKIDGCTRHAAA